MTLNYSYFFSTILILMTFINVSISQAQINENNIENSEKLNPNEKNKNSLYKKGILGKFKTVYLGMTREMVLSQLEKDPDLEIDADTQFGYFDKEQKYIIKAKRKPFIKNIYYQFIQLKVKNQKKNEKSWILYAIIISFNKIYNNYFNLYSLLMKKYGQADIKKSKYSIWQVKNRNYFNSADGRKIKIQLILNFPATIKIIDKSLYLKQVQKTNKALKSTIKNYQDQVNKRLLEDFIIETEF